jgi:hypothetical protein
VKLISFVDFLNTGRLGPLHPGMTLNEVAGALGPPAGWIVNPAEGIAPHYWVYGRHLEVSLRFEEAAYCDWFQIEHAGDLSGDAVSLNDDMAIALDGLSGTSPMSDFIRSIADIDRVSIQLISPSHRPDPIIRVGDVQIICCTDEDALDPGYSLSDKILFYEKNAEVDSIYSYFRDEERRRNNAAYLKQFERVTISGRAYLDTLREHA